MSKREGALSDKDVSFSGWGKSRCVFLFLVLSFSLFPIFLSGFGLGDLGFLFLSLISSTDLDENILENYLVAPFELITLITQLVLLGESSICPGSPWMFHEVFSSPSFFFLFSFLEIFLLWKFFCLFPNFIYLALGWKRRSSSSLAFSFFSFSTFRFLFEGQLAIYGLLIISRFP